MITLTCENCDPTPYKLISVAGIEDPRCEICGKSLMQRENRSPIYQAQKGWDTYFHGLCKSVASKSPCLSRKIGAILVRDKSIISTGYNGPPRGVPHCGHERFMVDKYLQILSETSPKPIHASKFYNTCPRKVMGFQSGTHMELCPAQHAEENAVSNAARLGTSVLDSTLYMDSVIPCKNCFGTLINAGITEIVVEEVKVYDKHTQFLVDNSNIRIREFEL